MVPKKKLLELRLKNPATERGKVLSALKTFASKHQLPASAVNAADLALEEHLTNLSKHAYQDKGLQYILVRFAVRRGRFVIEVLDDGKPFNPLQVPPVDTSKPLGEKPIGGLGIHLIRHFMDDLKYHRKGSKNVLTMRKNLA